MTSGIFRHWQWNQGREGKEKEKVKKIVKKKGKEKGETGGQEGGFLTISLHFITILYFIAL